MSIELNVRMNGELVARWSRTRTGGHRLTNEKMTAIGRDCVGAVQLLPPATAPEGFDRIDRVPIDDAEVEHLLRSVTAQPLPGANEDRNEFRISIAGAQEKTALVCKRGKWFRPLGSQLSDWLRFSV